MVAVSGLSRGLWTAYILGQGTASLTAIKFFFFFCTLAADRRNSTRLVVKGSGRKCIACTGTFYVTGGSSVSHRRQRQAAALLQDKGNSGCPGSDACIFRAHLYAIDWNGTEWNGTEAMGMNIACRAELAPPSNGLGLGQDLPVFLFSPLFVFPWRKSLLVPPLYCGKVLRACFLQPPPVITRRNMPIWGLYKAAGHSSLELHTGHILLWLGWGFSEYI